MVSQITRAATAKQLEPGRNEIVGLNYGEVANEHLPLFEVGSSNRSFEEEVLMAGFGNAVVKPEGEAVTFDLASEQGTSRYTAETIALAFAITEEAFEDNLYDTFSKLRAKELARAMASTKQLKAANIFNNGHTAGFVGGDGVPLYSASHPTQAGTQSNTTTADLSETALENAHITVTTMKNDRGILIGANVVLLAVPPQNQFVAERLLMSERRVGTADNDANALKNKGIFSGGYVVNRRFTNASSWYIKTDVPNGVKMFVRKPLQTKMDVDFYTGSTMYKARERYAFGWTDWRGTFGSDGSA